MPRSGTFWWILPNGTAVPAPCAPLDLTAPIYQLAANRFLVDETGGAVPANTRRFGMQAQTAGRTTAFALETEADTVMNLIIRVQTTTASAQMQTTTMAAFDGMIPPGSGGGGTNGFYSDSFNYTVPTNGLWLEITNVANGLAYLNLNNATDSVYEILSKTDLTLTDWNIETEVWPTDTNSMPFTVPELSRTNLFLWARDWTGITSNGNETPDWWFWKYFGTVDLSDSDPDSNGRHTLWSDYSSGTDPNVISFTMWAAKLHVNTAWVPLQISLSGGIPAYAAVLVNDINYADAGWQTYTGSNVVVTLGGGDGIYGVRLGLRGLPADAQQTWNNQAILFKLDRVAPVVTITNPVENVVSTPTIQVQGFVNEQLSSLTYDVSNAAGIFTNQTGYVTGAFYDINLPGLTTNYFQCYDVPLTNGLNIITLHATDLAGNTTTTNVSVTSDYSGDTTAPLLTVIWPQNGTAVSGSQFTFHGAVDKPGAAITAIIVDANGDTNIVQGLVEQNGTVWAQNLPLASGANTLTLTAANAAGTNTIQLTLYQSDVLMTMNPLSGGQLNQPSVNVTGTVSDPGCSVYVNDVEAYYVDDAGGWAADGVPVSPSGTAIFDVEVYAGESSSAAVRTGEKSLIRPADTGSGLGIGSEQFALALPVKVGMMSYMQNSAASDLYPHEHSMVPPIGEPAYDNSDGHTIWNYRSGGLDAGHSFFSGDYTYWTPPEDETRSDLLPGGQDNYNAPWEIVSAGEAGQYENWTFIDLEDFAREYEAQARVMLEPSGQQAAGITNYYLVQAEAWGFSDPNAEWDNWPLPPDTLTIGGVALTLATNGDGSVYGETLIVARAGQNVEVTPISTNKNYLFNVQAFTLERVMAVDNNRDGNIAFDNSDATTPQLPFRFWMNDSQEGGDISTADNDVPGQPASVANWNLNQVNGRADVVNFFPVAFNLARVFEQWPWTNSEYHLSQADSAVKIVYTGLQPGNAFDYLTDPLTPDTYGTNFNEALTNADTIQVTNSQPSGTILDTNWLAQVQNSGGYGVILMEGCTNTTKPLNLEIWQNGQMVQAMSCYISVSGVEQMYRQINLRFTGGSTADPGQPSNYPDSLCNGNHVVFIHGYSVSGNDARGWSAEAFKRLYQAHSHAMFTGVDWSGDDGWQIPSWVPVFGGDIPNYYTNVASAFLTASNFEVAVSGLPGTQKYVIAHSLGNMVVSSAIQDFGLSVNSYFALDAAVATEAYDGNTGTNNMVNPTSFQTSEGVSTGYDWADYDTRLWSTEWYRLFDSGDGRNGLTWRNRFSVIPNLYNFYSSGEDVLDNSDGTVPGVFSVASTGERSWVLQEMNKGNGLFSISQAGWATSTHWLIQVPGGKPQDQEPPPPSQTTTNYISDDDLKAHPFFSAFNDNNLMDSSLGSDEAKKFDVRAEVLAGGIPALSYATGRNEVEAFQDGNFDLMSMETTDGNGNFLWPASRPLDVDLHPRWLHSDFEEVAYPFNYSLYYTIVYYVNQ